jgi:predicted MFS family arabinose efflux permease
MAIVAALRAVLLGEAALLMFSFLTGLLFAVWAISLTVVIAQITGDGQRTLAFSVYLGTAIGIGVVADPIGGWLPRWIGTTFEMSSPLAAKRAVLFLAATVIGLAVLPACRLRIPDPPRTGRLTLPRGPFVRRFLLAVIVLNVATAAFNPFANAFFSQHLAMSTEQIGFAFSGGQVAQVAAILVSPWLLRRLDVVWGVATMEIAAGASLAVLALGSAGGWAALGYAGYMAFQWMDEPAMESLLMSRVQAPERSGAAALMYISIYAAGAVTTPLAGQAIHRFGYPAVMLAAAALLFLGGILFGALLPAPLRAQSSSVGDAVLVAEGNPTNS